MTTGAKYVRWLQRLETYGKTLAVLTKTCSIRDFDDISRAALVKHYELCFGIAWLVLKDLLSYEGIEIGTPRGIYRKSFEIGYISERDCEVLLGALDYRNRLTHIYDEELALEAEKKIVEEFYPVLNRLHAALIDIAKA